MKRANDEFQKTQRRQEILNEAAGLLVRRDFEAVTLSEVAGNLGLVKGTLYRYFPTKEVLVLEVLERELQLWLEDLSGALLPGELGVPSLVDHLARSLGARPLLVRLFSIVHVQLEKHLNLVRLVEFKKTTAAVMHRAASLIEAASPPLAGKGTNAVLILYELAIGVGHVTERSPLVEQALTDPFLEVFRLEFVPALRDSLLWTFTGLAASETPGSG